MMVEEIKQKCEKENEELSIKIKETKKNMKLQIRDLKKSFNQTTKGWLKQIEMNNRVLSVINPTHFRGKYKKRKKEQEVDSDVK